MNVSNLHVWVLCGWWLLAAGGCATVPTECAAPRIEKVYVPVPQEAKRELPAAPAWKVDALPIGAPISEQVKALVAERNQRKGYEIELLGSCK